MNFRLLFPLAACALLSACASAPKPLQGQFDPITPQQLDASSPTGQTVRWGGRIIETSPQQNQTCFQLLSLPLNAYGRPVDRNGDANQGRFIACRTGFYDPAVFQPGRDITLIGRVDSQQTITIGEYTYPVPRIAADVIYLWPELGETVERPPYPYYAPYGPYGAWGPYRRFGWYGWW